MSWRCGNLAGKVRLRPEARGCRFRLQGFELRGERHVYMLPCSGSSFSVILPVNPFVSVEVHEWWCWIVTGCLSLWQGGELVETREWMGRSPHPGGWHLAACLCLCWDEGLFRNMGSRFQTHDCLLGQMSLASEGGFLNGVSCLLLLGTMAGHGTNV